MSSPRSNRPTFSPRYTVTGCFHGIHHSEQSTDHATWPSKICHCCHDPRSCWLTFFCPCITFGWIASYADEESSSCVAKGALYCLAAALTGCLGGGVCWYGYCNRRKMRTRLALEQKTCNDCCVHCFCHCCALCQEYRHLQSLGHDLFRGREEDGQMRNGSTGLTPPPMTRMSRRPDSKAIP